MLELIYGRVVRKWKKSVLERCELKKNERLFCQVKKKKRMKGYSVKFYSCYVKVKLLLDVDRE